MMTIPSAVNAWLETEVFAITTQRHLSTSPLAGDGSTRHFYRVKAGGKTFILLHEPGWKLSQDYLPHQQHLAQRSVPVPHFFAESRELGCLLMQDLGDELLQFRIVADPTNKMVWLQRATELLANYHLAHFPLPRSLPGSQRQFDAQKYSEEFAYTLEHLHEKFLALPAVGAEQRAALRQFCARIAALGPVVLCHRDFHTRNILISSESLYLIDFQDARVGSPHYDVASLIYDPYIPLSSAERSALLAHYRASLGKTALSESIDWLAFANSVALVGYQRTLKAAGSFASFFTRNGKATHLQYILPALHQAAELVHLLSPAEASALPLLEWIDRMKSAKKNP